MLQELWNRLASSRRSGAEIRRAAVLSRAVRDRSSALDPLQSSDRPGEAFEASWRDAFKRRVFVALCGLTLWATAVEARLIYLQVVQHAEYLDLATGQQIRTITVGAMRGDILDRNGEILAMSLVADSVIAAPSAVKDPAATAQALCGAFGDCTPKEQTDLVALLSKDSNFAFVRHAKSVTPDQAKRVAALKLPGIRLISDTGRFYPNRDLASHVLGFVDDFNDGLAGIESAYDKEIHGEARRLVVQKDGRRSGNVMQTLSSEGEPGATIQLTIDHYIQHIAERELQRGVEEHHADGGTAVVMNPRTGEILAMASYPTFDPNAQSRFSDDQKRNRAIQGAYEPGSTFKIVTASAALQENVWSMSDQVDTSPGFFYIGKRKIKDTEGHNYGLLSFQDVIVKSSNVGASRIGLRVGAERFERYVSRLGFGEAHLPDLRGEDKGLVTKTRLVDDSALASMSMGYQIGVTPLQMALAVSAIANGGTLNQPRLVHAVTHAGDRTVNAPTALRQAVTAETAATVTSIMEEVVRRGTGTKAQLAGYQVAGKTGTAYKNQNGRYSATDYNASFVGFVPSRNPELTIVVVVDTPRGGVYFGGDVAAPIFKRIAEASLRQLGVPPTLNPLPSIVVTADQSVATPAVRVNASDVRRLLDLHRMPDVRGLSAREALRVLGAAGLTARFVGEGVVISQSPEVGAAIESGDPATLHFARQSSDPKSPGGARR